MNNTKICLVTGANQGIGFAIAKELVKLGHKVVMVNRNENRSKEAIEQLRKINDHADIDLVLGNLSTIREIKDVGRRLKESYDVIDVIFHNAGVWPTRKVITEDGFEEAFVVNHLAIFQLTFDLMDSLMAAQEPRIVFVNAGLILQGKFDIDLTPYGKDFSRMGTYCNTKLATIYFMNKLVEKIDSDRIIINALHPGVFRTSLGESGIMKYLLKFFKIFMKSTKSAAKGPLYLAFSPEVKTSGGFYNITELMELPDFAKDAETADQLWRLSEQVLDLQW
ncbi:MAG: SDR family NAD(P)-dependent oxidoreductase [Candidatus Heimdallarchaeota archaeon]|nr:SDR family NAD(P)-dependent oxidoreductase [Candidatus Heimdallarchaeota archaeon]